MTSVRWVEITSNTCCILKNHLTTPQVMKFCFYCYYNTTKCLAAFSLEYGSVWSLQLDLPCLLSSSPCACLCFSLYSHLCASFSPCLCIFCPMGLCNRCRDAQCYSSDTHPHPHLWGGHPTCCHAWIFLYPSCSPCVYVLCTCLYACESLKEGNKIKTLVLARSNNMVSNLFILKEEPLISLLIKSVYRSYSDS